jgi:putative membrane protein
MMNMKIQKIKWMCAVLVGCTTAAMGFQALAQDAANDATRSQDKMFVQAAAEGGLFEVKMGQLAAEKAEAPDVKAFGEKMVHDHTMLNDQMKPVADSLGVTAPDQLDAKDQAEYDKFNAMSGHEFDQAYVKAMVMDHRKDLRAFRHEEASTQDPQLKQAVAGGEKLIAEHLHIITDVAQKNGVSVPTRGGV